MKSVPQRSATIVTDSRFIPTYINDEALGLLSMDRETALQSWIPEIFQFTQKSNYTEFRNSLEIFVIGNGEVEHPFRIDIINVEKCSLEVKGNIIKISENGKIKNFVFYFQNVTKKFPDAEAIIDSDSEYHKIVLHAPFGVIIHRGEKPLYFNKYVLNLFKISKLRPPYNFTILDYVLPENHPQVQDSLYNRKNINRSVQNIINVITSKGDIRTVITTGVKFRFQRKLVYITTLVDITKQEKIRRKLRESEKLCKTLVDSASDIIYTLDENGVYLSVNKEFARTVNKKKKEILGENIRDLFPKDIAEYQLENIEKVFRSGRTAYAFDILSVTAFGERWYNTTLKPIKDSSGKLEYILGIGRDVTENKWAEGALKDSERKFRLLAENSSDIIWTMDADFKYTYISPSVRSILGYFPKEVIGKSIRDFLPPEYFKKVVSLHNLQLSNQNNIKADQKTIRIELLQLRKNKTELWTEVVTSPLRDGKGFLFGIIGVTRDISERRRAEQILKDSEQKYRTVVENANDCICIIKERCLKYVNNKFTEILEYTVAELKDMPILKFVCSSTKPKVKKLLNELSSVLKDGDKFEMRMKSKSGKTKTFEVGFSRTKYKDEDAALLILREITQRKKMELALRKSERNYRLLVETTSDWVWEVDEKMCFTYSNPNCFEIIGYKPNEIIGLTPFDFMSSPEAEKKVSVIYRKIERKVPFHSVSNVYIHRDGREVISETSGVPILGKRGKLFGYRGIDRNITERKRAEKDSELLIIQLKEAFKKIKTLSGLVPICAKCKKIRDDKGFWNGVEKYVTEHSDAVFTHGLCNDCAVDLYPSVYTKSKPEI